METNKEYLKENTKTIQHERAEKNADKIIQILFTTEKHRHEIQRIPIWFICRSES